MSSSVEERLARLEESVQFLEEAAAQEAVRRKNARTLRLVLLIVVGVLYAYYLGNVSELLTGG